MTGDECLPEFDVSWTAVGMVGVEEPGNATGRILFVIIVTSNWAAWPRVYIRVYCRGRDIIR